MKKQVPAHMKVFRVAVLLIACAGALTGCAESLNSEMQTASLSSGITTASVRQEPMADSKLTRTGLKAQTGTTSRRLPGEAGRSPSKTTLGTTPYKIGTRDILDIAVFQVPELSRSVQVTDAGTVNLPLLGEIWAAGKTTQELERDLTSKLGAKYLEAPEVMVLVKEYNSQRVTVDGAVSRPGLYTITGRTSLLQVVAMAGGIDTAIASGDVAVVRHVDGKRYVGIFDIHQVRAGQAQDPAINSGDVIVVTTSGIKTTFNNVLKVLPITSLLMPAF
jgi:polysaccharide export outer membrane protein